MTSEAVAMNDLLTEADFEAWFATKRDDEIVGQPGSGSNCPIAVCLRECGAPYPVVMGTFWAADAEAGFENAPAWVELAVFQFDYFPDGHDITAAEARERWAIVQRGDWWYEP